MQNSQKETGVNYQFSAKYLVIPTYKKSFSCKKKHYTEEIFYMVTSEKVRFLPKIPEHFEF